MAWLLTFFAMAAGAAAIGGWLSTDRDSSVARGAAQADLHITEPGGAAGGTPLDLSSFAAASASLGAGELRIEWPGADALGDNEIQNVRVTIDSTNLALVFDGSLALDGSNVQAMLIIDWEDATSTPTISLGVQGQLDMADLNPDWKLQDDSSFVIDGYMALATGTQDLEAISSAASFYGDLDEIGAGIEVRGGVNLSSVLPGAGVNSNIELAMSATLDADIEALLTGAALEPTNPSKVTFVASINAGDLGIPDLVGLTAGSFEVQVDLAGGSGDDEESLAVNAAGEIELDNDAISQAPVTFDVNVNSSEGDVTMSGGLKEGTTWTNPFGAPVTAENLRFELDVPGGDDEPTLTVGGDISLNLDAQDPGDEDAGLGFNFEVVASEELDVSLALTSDVKVSELAAAFGQLGLGDVTVPGDLATASIDEASLELSTRAGSVDATLEVTVSFRGAEVTLLISGSTEAGQPLLVAALFPSEIRVRDLAPTVASIVGDWKLPSGGFVLSTEALDQADVPEGRVANFLDELFCGVSDAGDTLDCEYEVPSGLSLAAQVDLPKSITDSLAGLGELADVPVRVSGTLPIFGEGDLSLKVELPSVKPGPGSTNAWLDEARLSLEVSLSGANLEISIVGELDTLLPDDTEVPSGVDEVTFTATGTLSIGTDGLGLKLTAEVGAWETPFGLAWLDLNGVVLSVDVQVGPQVSVTVGVAAGATVQPPCVVFDTTCPVPAPAPITFEASFAIGVKGPPFRPVFGFRAYASELALRDVAEIANAMGANVDVASLPAASLQDVEFSFSQIDAPELCLKRGLIIAADVYLDDADQTGRPAPTAVPEIDPGICTSPPESPLAAANACLTVDACLAHLRLDVGEDGIQAGAAINEFELGPITVDDAYVALSLTEGDQSFSIAGGITVDPLGSAQGSLALTTDGVDFSLTLDGPDGGTASVSGSAGLNDDENGFAVDLEVFVDIPGMSAVLNDAQLVDFRNDLRSFFGVPPVQTVYSLRCISFELDLEVGAADPFAVSGGIAARVHFSAIDILSGFEDGRVWNLSWDFDDSLVDNVVALVPSLTGATAIDEIGCNRQPTPVGVSQIDFNTGTVLQGPGSDVWTFDVGSSIRVGPVVDFRPEWISNDFAVNTIAADLNGNGEFVVLGQSRTTNGSNVFADGGAQFPYQERPYRRTAVFRYLAQDGSVMDTLTKELIIGGNTFSGHTVTTAQPDPVIAEGSTVQFRAEWIPLRPDLAASSSTSWNYQLRGPDDAIISLGGVTIPTGSLDSYPLNPANTETKSISIPSPCTGCVLSVTHRAASDLAGGENSFDDVTLEFPVEYADPEITLVGATNVVGEELPIGDSRLGPLPASSEVVVEFSDPTVGGPYDLYVNEINVATRATPGSFDVPLVDFHEPGAGNSELTFEVVDTSSVASPTSTPVTHLFDWLPENSAVTSPTTIPLGAGQTTSVTVTSTTRFPQYADDGGEYRNIGPETCGAVWFSYTAPADGGLLLETDGSAVAIPRPDGSFGQELSIAVFTDAGGLVAELTQDLAPATVYPQVLTFPVQQGATYEIAVAASDQDLTFAQGIFDECLDDPTASGPILLTATQLETPPIEDTVRTPLIRSAGGRGFALVLSGGSEDVSLDFSTSSENDDLALSAPGFEDCFSDPLEQSVWFSFDYDDIDLNVPIDVIALTGQGSDVQLAVVSSPFPFNENDPTELVGCAERSSGTNLFFTDAPNVTFTPERDRSYSVMIDTNGRQTAAVTPIVTTTHSTPLNARQLVTGDDPYKSFNVLGSAFFQNRFVDIENSRCTSETIGHEHYYTWTATNSDAVDISLRGDIDANIYAVAQLSGQRLCATSTGRADVTLTVNPTAGETYTIVVGSPVREEGGTYEIGVYVRGDDTRSPAPAEVADFPATFGASNTGATTDGATSSCVAIDDSSIVHELTVPNDLEVDIDTFGSELDTRLVVTSITGLEIACNDDADGGFVVIDQLDNIQTRTIPTVGDSRVRITADDADTYVVRVDGANGAEGDVQFSVTTRGDNVANAVVVTGKTVTSTLSNEFASVEPDEQRGACHQVGDALNNTVWWSWTAPAGADAFYDIEVSGLDAQLTVFEQTGGALGAIIGCGEAASAAGTATDNVTVSGGQTLFIQADGVGKSTGDAQLRIAFDKLVPVIPPTVPTEPPEVFSPLNPVRIADTRSNGVTIDTLFQGDGEVQGGTFYEIDIVGRGGVPSDAAAAVLNITSVRSQGRGFLTVYPCGEQPNASAVNFEQGANTPNEVIAKLSAQGSVCVFSSTSTQLLVDVVAYITADAPYSALNPSRLVDTRPNGATIDELTQGDGTVEAGSFYEIQIAGRGGVSPTAEIAVLNVTSVRSAESGFLTVWPCGERPNASALNYQQGVNTANEIITKLSASGSVCIFSSQATELLVDVVGEITGGSSSGFQAVTPARLADTRAGGTTDDGEFARRGTVSGGDFYEIQITGRGGVPSDATTAILNVTSVRPATGGFFTVWSCGTRPTASALNFATGQNRANEIIAKLSATGSICVFTSTDAEILLDVVGSA